MHSKKLVYGMQRRLDEYGLIRCINFIRSEVAAGGDPRPQLAAAAEPAPWADDRFLQPVLPNDALLMHDFEEEEDAAQPMCVERGHALLCDAAVTSSLLHVQQPSRLSAPHHATKCIRSHSQRSGGMRAAAGTPRRRAARLRPLTSWRGCGRTMRRCATRWSPTPCRPSWRFVGGSWISGTLKLANYCMRY